MSSKLYQRLKILYNSKQEWFSSENPVSFAKGIISIEKLPNSDKKHANAFITVVDSSLKYWKTKLETTKNYQDVIPVQSDSTEPCDVAPYGADAAGVVYGSLAGPVSSAVNGAIFSAWTEVSCNYHTDS